ncbi:hypothetical protein [Gulbenkiania mobilis]|uniref:hypothetical protein n=1 Tax=Gulbenkiania mobilis TaxID=397457 RepID=UPI00128EC956|nr:hypothetical protein [Gulbenkiania mobilis]
MNHHEKLFAKMQAYIESGDAPIQGYQVDFYKYDREHLAQTAFPGMRYLWVVRRYGTHLIPVGLHECNAAYIEAAIHAGSASVDTVFFDVRVRADGDGFFKPITRQQAQDLAKLEQFAQRDGLIWRGKEVVAGVECKLERIENRLNATVIYRTATRQPDAFERHVLRVIAGQVASKEAQSLFVQVGDIVLDGKSMIASAEAEQSDLLAA